MIIVRFSRSVVLKMYGGQLCNLAYKALFLSIIVGHYRYRVPDCWHGHCHHHSQNKRVDKGKSGLPSDCGEWKLWGRHPLTIEKKAGGGSFGGTGLALARQSKGNCCEAADRRPDKAWGSLPGRSAARIFFGIKYRPQMNRIIRSDQALSFSDLW